jgi:hypothetical protein
LRSSSGGRFEILFAVATTKAGLFFSYIHVRKFPKRRVVVSEPPPPACTPENAFSKETLIKHG